MTTQEQADMKYNLIRAGLTPAQAWFRVQLEVTRLDLAQWARDTKARNPGNHLGELVY